MGRVVLWGGRSGGGGVSGDGADRMGKDRTGPGWVFWKTTTMARKKVVVVSTICVPIMEGGPAASEAMGEARVVQGDGPAVKGVPGERGRAMALWSGRGRQRGGGFVGAARGRDGICKYATAEGGLWRKV